MNNSINDWQVQYSSIVSNISNPFDQAGRKHNELMETIEQRGVGNMTTSQMFDLIDEVIQEQYGMEIHRFSSQVFSSPIMAFQNRTDMENFVSSLAIDENAKSKMLALIDIMLRYDTTNLSLTIASIINFENGLIISDNSNRNVYKEVLIASSIGRYSLCYWHNRLLSSNVAGVAGERSQQIWKKIFVGLADLIGGVAGAVVGGATVFGGIAGGVTGAITTSTNFAKLWDIYAE